MGTRAVDVPCVGRPFRQAPRLVDDWRCRHEFPQLPSCWGPRGDGEWGTATGDDEAGGQTGVCHGKLVFCQAPGEGEIGTWWARMRGHGVDEADWSARRPR